MDETRQKCPFCNSRLVGSSPVICVNCGKNLRTGKQLKSKAETGKKRQVARKLTGLIAVCVIIFCGIRIYHKLTRNPDDNIPETASEPASLLGRAKSWFGSKTIAPADNGEDDSTTPAASGKDILADIVSYDINIQSFTPQNYKSINGNFQQVVGEYRLRINGDIDFLTGHRHDLIVKIYRSVSLDKDFKLVYSRLYKSIFCGTGRSYNKGACGYDLIGSPADGKSTSPDSQAGSIANYERIKHRISAEQRKQLDAVMARHKAMLKAHKMADTHCKVPLSEKRYYVRFALEDFDAEKCGTNNVYYKIELCNRNGELVREFEPRKVALLPEVRLAADGKSWSWSPLYPGKDPIDGVIAEDNFLPTKCVKLSNQQIAGKCKKIDPFRNESPKIYLFGKASRWSFLNEDKIQNKLYYSHRLEQSPFRLTGVSLVDKINQPAIGLCYDSSGCLILAANFNVKFDKVILNGQRISLTPKITILRSVKNGKSQTRKLYRFYFRFPGRATVSFKYKGKPVDMHFVVPPEYVIANAAYKDHEVKLTWTSLAGFFKPQYFMVMPEYSITRKGCNDQGDFRKIRVSRKNLGKLNINSSAYSDRNITAGWFYQYEVRIDSGVMNVPFWSAGNGLKTMQLPMLMKKDSSCMMTGDTVVYASEEKPPPRPLRIGIWPPELCFCKTALPAVRLKEKVVNVLAENNCMVFDRAHRSEIIQEKILTMSYEKSMAIQTVPADFSIFIRDYCRESGNGVELWLVQNKFLEIPLKAVGVKTGDCLFVHSSVSAFG
ncbi:MAG: hypothetical protein PHV59_10730, partial [Victivallales bacterium]|nr:hypothetical protein [Victivallales bacterium]